MNRDETQLVRLIALLLTDGGISKASKNLYEIYITNNSNIILNMFEACIEDLFGKQKFYRYKFKTVKKVKITSKEIGIYLLKFSSSYRTRPCNTYPKCLDKTLCRICRSINGYPPARIPKFILNGKIEIRQEFLKIAFSADGCIEFYENKNKKNNKKSNKKSIQRRISLFCSNPYILKQFKTMIKKCGFNITFTKTEIRITGKKQLNKFKNEIGFLDGVVVSSKSKFWCGYDKNELLRIVLNSYWTDIKSQSNPLIAGSSRNVS